MKTKQRPGVTDATARKTVRVNVRLEVEAQKRLAVHCATTGMSPGEVLTRMCEGLREWSMPAKLSDRVKNHDRPLTDGHVNSHAPSDPAQLTN